MSRTGPRLPVLAWLITTLLLTLLTLVVFRGMERFEPVPVDWPQDPGFEQLAAALAHRSADPTAPLPSGWQIEGDPSQLTVERGVLRLRNTDPEASIGVRQIFELGPDDPRTFYLEAVASSRNVRGQRPGFRVGEVSFVADHDIDRSRFTSVHRLAALRGDRGPERFAQTFRFPSTAQRIELGIRLRHATGTLAVRSIRLTGLAETSAFRLTRLILTAVWTLTIMAGTVLFWRGIDDRRTGAALVAAAIAGLGLLLMPSDMREAWLMPLAQLIPGHDVDSESPAVFGHFAIFAVTGLLVRLARREEHGLIQLALLVGLAGLSELLQFMAELRTPSLDDWLTNTLGALAGWVPAALWLAWSRRGPFERSYSATTEPPQAAKQRR